MKQQPCILSKILIFTILLSSCGLVNNVQTSAQNETTMVSPQNLLSVAISGLEDSQGVKNPILGEHFTTTPETTYQTVANLGFKSVKIAFDWQSIDSNLNGSLDTDYLNVLKNEIEIAKKYNLEVILDMHNFGRFGGEEDGLIVGKDISFNKLANTWLAINEEFKNDDSVIAYNIMTEPQNMPVPTTPENYKNSTATQMYQSVVTKLRKNKSTKLLIVQLDDWAMVQSFSENYGVNPDPWINDPLDNIIYEAHYYLDQDSSGRYENETNQPVADLSSKIKSDLQPYLDWCKRHKLVPYIGEVGVPNTEGWQEPLAEVTKQIKNSGGSLTYWAVGGWYDSPTSANPGTVTQVTGIKNSNKPKQLQTIANQFK